MAYYIECKWRYNQEYPHNLTVVDPLYLVSDKTGISLKLTHFLKRAVSFEKKADANKMLRSINIKDRKNFKIIFTDGE